MSIVISKEQMDEFIARTMLIQYKKGSKYITKQNLQECLIVFEDIEDYETCGEVKWLIENYGK